MPRPEPRSQNHQQSQHQPYRGGGLNPAGELAAPPSRCVLGHVSCGAAVLAAERQPLQQPERDQNRRGGQAQRGIAGQHGERERRKSHDHNCDQESVLAAHHVAEPTEHERAERPHREARRERQQGEDVARALVERREELRADDRREHAEQVKVVPLEDCPKGRSEDHALLVRGHGSCCCAHVRTRARFRCSSKPMSFAR